MRNFCFTTICLGFLLIANGGCRQTNGVSSFGSSLFGTGNPSSPNALAPNNALTPMAPGQTPALGTFNGVGPFGGSTRVTPPPTGSFAAPNNYMGYNTPAGNSMATASTNFPTNRNTSPNLQQAVALDGFAGSGAGTSIGSTPIGSGVRPAGWTETTANVPGNIDSGNNVPGNIDSVGSRALSSDRRDPRAGGMQVIDLTGAAKPPGYRSMPSAQVAAMPLSRTNNAAMPNSTAMPNSGQHSYANRVPQFESRTSGSTSFPPQSSASNFTPISASSLPATNPTSIALFPTTAPATTSVSRNAAAPNRHALDRGAFDSNSQSRTADASHLTWRRPGTR